MWRFIPASLLLLSACAADSDKKEVCARVFDKELSRKEVLKSIPYGTNPKDSAEIAKNFIEQWIRKQAVLQKAELNMSDEQKEVGQQLEDYRTSLLIFAYEQELVRQKLDTLVSAAEIENYYRLNPGNFELKNNIIRLRYVKLPLTAPGVEKVKNWLKQNEKDRLEQYCRLHAVNYLLFDDNWLLMDDVLKEIPLAGYSTEQFARNNRMLEIKDKEYFYLINIADFMVKDSKAPLSFVKDDIRNIILNKRKIKLIQQMQEDAYKEVLDRKDAEIFYEK
jgi:hypothetical protein